MTADVPDSHPRAASLRTRDRLVEGLDRGLTSRAGLIAHGRGEAFDYLLGERTIPSADRAARAAAAHLLAADHPAISVNGNVAALATDLVVDLAEATDAAIEVNLFHRSADRMAAIADHLRAHGASEVLGLAGDGRIPGLEHDRAICDADGIERADVVVVPLEDGDRAAALDAMGKTEIVIDLNPLSRSAQVADVPIVDNVVRALPAIAEHSRELAAEGDDPEGVIEAFDASEAISDAERTIREGSLAE
ncbi:MAG: 4-phosphopantoate--beta-alanine ligase [Halococcoides sp.]